MTAPLLRAVERLLLPNACVCCERWVGRTAPDRLLCPVCRARMRPLAPGCRRCRQPLPPLGPCRFCAPWPEVLREVHSAVWLGPEARALIHHLKYEGYQQLGDTAAEWIARTRPAPCGQAVLVPVPLSPRRLRRRGYNQAAPIAHALGSRWRLPVSEDILRRVRESESQTALTPEERERNVAGAFVAAPPPAAPGQRGQVGQVAEASWQRLRPRSAPTTSSPPPAPAGCGGAAVIILVDDVLTTGATLAAAARALERAGWEAIGAVTFARALPYELAALHR